MFITKKHLSRRTFLRGAGVAVGLPLLDAMVPAWTQLVHTAAAPKPRMGFMYLPHGAIMENWTPAAVGTGFELSPILQPFAPFKNQLTIISGLENKPAIAPPVHALNPGTWLSCVTPEGNCRSSPATGFMPPCQFPSRSQAALTAPVQTSVAAV